jgi:hypothetical protein
MSSSFSLVSLVLQVLHLDLDARVLGFEVARDLLPDLHLHRIGFDMQPPNRGLGGGQSSREPESGDRQEGAPDDSHCFLTMCLLLWRTVARRSEVRNSNPDVQHDGAA